MKWAVTFYKRETYEYEVEGKDYDEAFNKAVEEVHDHDCMECDSEYNIEEIEENDNE